MDDTQASQPQSLDDLLKGLVTQKELEQISSEEIPPSARRPVVASFITKALIWLFVGQMSVITLLHAGVVIATGANKTVLDQSVSAVLEGVKTIIPVTTTLLGVAIGYYFRTEAGAEQQGTSGSPPPE